jgi:hypothetical protein
MLREREEVSCNSLFWYPLGAPFPIVLPLHPPLLIPSGHYIRRYGDGCMKVHLYLFDPSPFPLHYHGRYGRG